MDANDKTAPLLDTLQHRKGARKAGEIPAEVISLLQSGQLETVNLTEWLAVDHNILLQHVLAEFGLQHHSDSMLEGLAQVKEKTITKIVPAVAQEWLRLLQRMPEEERSRIFNKLSAHRSDSVRCWAAYMVGLDQLDLEQKLTLIRPFGADEHFGVREMAWMTVRKDVSEELTTSIRILSDWVHEENAYIRRFAVEVTRPQGVWTKHIPQLKVNPDPALPLLEPLKSDPSKYVQDSVGNWLNDAAKTNPDWVIHVCKTWLESSDTKETKRITARAQRSLVKKA